MSGGGIPVKWQSIVTLFSNITEVWSRIEVCGGIKCVPLEILAPSKRERTKQSVTNVNFLSCRSGCVLKTDTLN